MFWVGKIIQPFLWPFNQALLVLALSVYFGWRGRQRAARALTAIALCWLLFWSMPWLAIALFRPLETAFLPKPYAAYPTADAIVVLGGTLSSVTPPRVEVEEMHGSRVIPAFRLWRMKKAPILVLSSGSDYFTDDGRHRVEADDMRELLTALGADAKALVVESRSRNTAENARYSGEWLRAHQLRHILLVTSAFHMRRAVPLFEAEGIQVTPVATEHRLSDRPVSFWDFFPDLSALGLATGAIKERVGFFANSIVLKFKQKELNQ